MLVPCQRHGWRPGALLRRQRAQQMRVEGRGVRALMLSIVVGALAASPASAATGSSYLCGPDSGYGCLAGTGYSGQSVWGSFGPGHNCVSYAAFRLAQTGIGQPWSPIGNGDQWDEKARGAQILVDTNPAVGSIAQWDTAGGGHVAYVEAVTQSYIDISEDSYPDHSSRRRLERSGSTFASAEFIHVKDVPPPPPPPPPATPPGYAGGGWESAFQANDGSLWIVGGDNKGAMNLGMATGTSPSVGRLSGGGWQTAFQANDNTLWIVGKDNKGAMNLGMKPATSPSITGLATGGWEAAFQANDGRLWIVGADNKGAMNLGMAPGTNPSIAAMTTSGWQTAFQANDNTLWIVGKDNRGAMNLGMKPGTSPSITGLANGGWQVAFQANDGRLWIVGSDNRGAMNLGMAGGTSPAITSYSPG